MKNIDYLGLFFKKHNLSGKITVKYLDTLASDDYMSDIVFENGDVISIQDVIFDIESDLAEDVVEQWLESKRKKDISLMEWMQTDNHYMPKIDTTSVEEFKMEMEEIVEQMKESINKVFELEIDDNEE